jgi:Lrp/AsnC family transcriptional regulator, leucine-responsive regulatory protein
MEKTSAFDILNKKTYKLDLKNKKLIAELLQNSRESFTQIAKKIGVSKESVQYRYHQLIEKQIVISTYARINYRALGYEKFHVLLLIDEKNPKQQDDFIKALSNDQNVLRVIEFNDDWDLEVVILAKDIRDFDKVLNRLLDPYADLIRKKDTEAVIDVVDKNIIPDIGKIKTVKSKTVSNVKIDEQDLLILHSLGKDARVSTYKISPVVKLSADAIGLRIKKLEKAGVIERYTCLLNFSNLDYLGFLFSFTMGSFPKNEEMRYFTFMSKNPYVLSIKKMLGKWDFKNYLIVKNMGDFHKIIKDLKREFSEFVHDYQTLVIYKEHMFNPCPDVVIGGDGIKKK